jgi:hypothetical protein
MKSGDMISSKSGSLLIIRALTFKEYCSKADESELEYDIEDAWHAWEKDGPVYEVLTEKGQLIVIWPSHVDSVISNTFEVKNEAR